MSLSEIIRVPVELKRRDPLETAAILMTRVAIAENRMREAEARAGIMEAALQDIARCNVSPGCPACISVAFEALAKVRRG